MAMSNEHTPTAVGAPLDDQSTYNDLSYFIASTFHLKSIITNNNLMLTFSNLDHFL